MWLATPGLDSPTDQDQVSVQEQGVALQAMGRILRQLVSVTLSLHYIAGVGDDLVRGRALAAIDDLDSIMFDLRAVHPTWSATVSTPEWPAL
jgi:hypothetical protein